jgi:ribosomal-protein-alanine N-acetyltransferase
MTDTDVTLRPIEEGDLAFLQDLTGNIANRASFQWHGFSDPREWRRRWDTPGAMMGEHGGVVLVMCGDVAAGMVSWSHQGWFGNQCWSIGITLSPAMRGRGYGTLAQRQLVDYLFRQTQVERIEAYTTPPMSRSAGRCSRRVSPSRARCAGPGSETAVGRTAASTASCGPR